MSKHIQQVSHYAPHERIKTFLIKRDKSHSNLTDGSAQSRLEAEVVKEGANASRIIMWSLYLCTKPKTSKMVQKRFHAIVEVKNFPHVSRVSCGNFGKGCYMQPKSLLGSVKKIDILGPAIHCCWDIYVIILEYPSIPL